jgi:glucose/arabinose dehydrogenase
MAPSPERSAFIRRLLLAGLVGSLLAACGGGDSESGTLAREPVPIHVQRGTEDPQASTAQALPPPEPADAPVLQAAPPATRDEPPSRAPTAQSTSAARAAAARLPTPSVLRQTVVTGLASPTDMAFTNEGLLFYAERLRGLSVQRPDVRCAGAASGDCVAAGEPAAMATAPHGWQATAPGEGLAAVELLRSPMWREWRNAFAVAFDAGRRLDCVKFDAAGRVVQAARVVERLGVGFRAVAQGPDGLYVMTSGKPGGDEIWRLLAH